MKTQKVQQQKPPLINAISVKTRLKTSFKSVAEKLKKSLAGWLITATQENAVAFWIESRDLQRRPYKCMAIKFYAHQIDMIYTIPPEESPNIRRWFVVRILINVLSLLEEDYELHPSLALQLLDGALSEIEILLKKDPGEMYVTLTRLRAEVTELRRRLKYLENEKKQLVKTHYTLSMKYEKLYRKYRELTKLKGEALKAKIQDWLLAHNGEINVIQFSKLYKVPVFLVEEALDEMVKEGYLQQI